MMKEMPDRDHMKLDSLLEGMDKRVISGKTTIDIAGITYDSRTVKKGYLFVAIEGSKHNGHDYIEDAIERGAAAIVFDNAEVGSAFTAKHVSCTAVLVKNSRKSLAHISNNFYLHPSASLEVIGITGTNGKTTTSYLLKSILEYSGKKVGLTGTIQYMIGSKKYEAEFTTPEPPEFQNLLYTMLLSGCTHVVSEVSSHALALHRVDGTVFQAGVFTNLTSEHLDFHISMDEYFKAKERFFKELLHERATAVINNDDIWGRKLRDTLSGKRIMYGLATGADLVASDIQSDVRGLRFILEAEGKNLTVNSPLVGLPNVYNILSAAGAARSLDMPWNVILDGIRNTSIVKGRFEKVDAGQDFLAIVDYAHTEDALERLIYSARGLTQGKIISVFGCGGDRDQTKRAKMGAIATRLSDAVIITSDNPRTEAPEKIIQDIETGAVRKNYLVEPDRRAAIKRAVLMATEGDIVLVAGKGHETYQEIKGEKCTFNDREVLEQEIRLMSRGNRST
jgi:UDP-N-acetylmuramoyl-L-alanyl-D-glutamate--2,6-diaminopimelate ligase